MLIGNYHHTIEAKGRLAIPKLFRSHLSDQLILTPGLETCLQLLPFNTWRKLTMTLGDHPLAGAPERDLRRYLASQAVEATFDSQGRIFIPDYLRHQAELTRKVVVIGVIDWVEIWDTVLYANTMSTLAATAPTLAAKLTPGNTNLSETPPTS